MTKEDLLNKKLHFTMESLRRFVKENEDLGDDTPILIERVTDNYFEKRDFNGNEISGWDVLKVEGYHYHSSLAWNEKIQAEIQRRERGEEPEYEMENPSEFIFAEKQLEEMKEQFYLAEGITTEARNESSKEIIYIYSHY